MFLGLIENPDPGDVAKVLKAYHVDRANFMRALKEVRGNQRVVSATPEDSYEALDKYGVDLVKLARENSLDPVIGRDTEIRSVVRILSRKTKNNPVLIGEPGVGKTAIHIKTDYISDHGLDYVEIRIKDMGTGISDEIIDNIFDPYVTTKPKGTGLGLAIVKKIIEEHGGVVWLENNLNSKGACAIIRLPAVMQARNEDMDIVIKGQLL